MKPIFEMIKSLRDASNEIFDVADDGMAGLLHCPSRLGGMTCSFIASWGGGWEHVSIANVHTTPSWDIMCYVKDLFWDGEEAVMQLHPPKQEYVNFHEHCLHLWRPLKAVIPIPPAILVGPRTPYTITIGETQGTAASERV